MPQYTVTIAAREFSLDDSAAPPPDIVAAADGSYHLIHEGRGYRCTVEEIDLAGKRMTVTVNGRLLTLQLADQYDLLVKQLGFSTQPTATVKEVHAPMPGLVLKVMVAPGAEVSTGTPLMILEAMKMENVLKAEGDGRIRAVHVARGEAVEKRQLLIELE